MVIESVDIDQDLNSLEFAQLLAEMVHFNFCALLDSTLQMLQLAQLGL